MHKSDRSARIFTQSIFGASLLMFPGLLDLALVPRFTCMALAVLVIIYQLNENKLRIKIKGDVILLGYFLYVVFSSLTIFWAKNLSEALFDSGRLWLAFSVFLFSTYYFKTRNEVFLSNVLKLSIVISLITLAFAIFQLLQLHSFKKEMMYKVSGLNSHKNLFSSFYFLTLPFLVLSFARLKGIWKFLSYLTILCGLAMLLILRTKAVWLGLGFSVLVFATGFGFYKLKKLHQLKLNPYLTVVILMLLANVFFLKILQPLIQKNTVQNSGIESKNTSLDQERLVVWDKTYTVFKKHPITGLGAGNWQIYFPDATLTGLWRVEDLNVTFQRPHNDFLWILSETGLIGFNFYLLFLFALLVFAFKALKLPDLDRRSAIEIAICVATICGYSVISFFDFPKERIEHLVWINIIFALLYSRIKAFSPPKSLFTFSTSPLVYSFSLVLFFFILSLGLLRIKGEYFTRLMYDYKNSGNVPSVITAGRSAWSFAYTIDPTSVPLDWYVGNANATMGNFPDAKKDFLSAYSYNPYNRNVINDLASACVNTQELDKGKQLYEEAARISPRFDEPKLNLAALYIAEENYEKAAFWLSSLLHDSERRSNYQKIIDLQKTGNPNP